MQETLLKNLSLIINFKPNNGLAFIYYKNLITYNINNSKWFNQM